MHPLLSVRLVHVSALLLLPSLLAPLLAGCDDPALEQGTPPAIALSQTEAKVLLFRYGAGRVLRQQVMALASDGRIRDLDASIQTTSLPQRDATRALLIQLGLDPARISWRSYSDNVLVLTRTTAVTAPCGTALKSDWQGDVGNSITSLGTCVQANNLADMVSDPRDLAMPVTLAPTNGAVAARAVRNWENGSVKQPPRRSLAGEDGGNGNADAGSGGGGGGSIPAGPAAGAELSAAPASAASSATDPLLSPAPLTASPGNE